MALLHHYHPHCGCRSCSQIEAQDERADELALGLHRNGDVLGEALGELTEEGLALMAAHLADGNDAGLAEILRTTVSDFIAELIERRMDSIGCQRGEAVQHLLTVYEVKPAKSAAMPWRVAA